MQKEYQKIEFTSIYWYHSEMIKHRYRFIHSLLNRATSVERESP